MNFKEKLVALLDFHFQRVVDITHILAILKLLSFYILLVLGPGFNNQQRKFQGRSN